MKIEVRTALLLSLIGFFWATLEFATGFHTTRINLHSKVTWIAILPIMVVYIYHYKKIKKLSNYQLSFKEGCKSGLITTLLSVPANITGFLLFYLIINPSFFENFKTYTIEKKIFSVSEASKYFTLSNYLLQIIIGSLASGLLLSLLLSLLHKINAK